MRGTLLAALAMAFVCVAAGSSRAADWTVQRFPAFGFSAAFPDTATRKTEPVATSGGPVATDYFFVRTDGRMYFVSSSDVSNQPEAMAKPDDAARMILQGAVGTGTVLASPARVTSPDGWEGRYKTDDLVVRIRTFVKGRHGFTVMILTKQETPERLGDAEAERFFSGFRLD